MSRPDWLAALAEGYTTGQFPQVWTIEQAAVRLGLGKYQAREALLAGGVTPVMRSSRSGAPHLFNPLDVEELKYRREWRPRGKLRRPAALRAKDSKRARWAARELVDGRLVAVKAAEHGSASTYSNHGCQCEPCTVANIAKLTRRRERLRRGVSPS